MTRLETRLFPLLSGIKIPSRPRHEPQSMSTLGEILNWCTFDQSLSSISLSSWTLFFVRLACLWQSDAHPVFPQLYGNLQRGESVQLEDGTVIQPNQVLVVVFPCLLRVTHDRWRRGHDNVYAQEAVNLLQSWSVHQHVWQALGDSSSAHNEMAPPACLRISNNK